MLRSSALGTYTASLHFTGQNSRTTLSQLSSALQELSAFTGSKRNKISHYIPYNSLSILLDFSECLLKGPGQQFGVENPSPLPHGSSLTSSLRPAAGRCGIRQWTLVSYQPTATLSNSTEHKGTTFPELSIVDDLYLSCSQKV